jgi:3-deoxy-D-manno-octulosonic-acid transferase
MPLVLPVMALHPRLRGGLAQRLGRLPAGLPERPIWLHGASAGDVVALLPLAERLREHGYRTLLTTFTRAGERMARRLGGPELPLLRAPLDLRGPVRRALDHLRPRLLVLECLEMWPTLLAACAERGVPVRL